MRWRRPLIPFHNNFLSPEIRILWRAGFKLSAYVIQSLHPSVCSWCLKILNFKFNKNKEHLIIMNQEQQMLFNHGYGQEDLAYVWFVSSCPLRTMRPHFKPFYLGCCLPQKSNFSYKNKSLNCGTFSISIIKYEVFVFFEFIFVTQVYNEKRFYIIIQQVHVILPQD